MSKCIYCGKELTTGDARWMSGTCNECHTKYFGPITTVYGITNVLISPHIIIHCLICGEEAKRLYNLRSETQTIDICDKCKKAVMKMREKTDGN